MTFYLRLKCICYPEIFQGSCIFLTRLLVNCSNTSPRCHFTPVTLRRRTGGTGGDPDDRYVVSLSRPRVSLLSPESPLMVTSANLGELCPIYNNFLNRRRAQICLRDCSIEYFHVVSYSQEALYNTCN